MLPVAGNVAEQASHTQARPSARWEATLRGNPLATDDFTAGAYPQPKAVAIRKRELAPDPDGWVRAIRHDVDRDDAVINTGALIESGALPAPSYLVENPRTGHAHVVWELGRWVRTDSARAVRLLARVRAALGEILGADRAYAGKFQHNPLHPDFQTWGDWQTWELGDLAGTLGDRLWAPPTLTRWGSRSSAQLDPQTAALGRNCSHFEHVRISAYAIVNDYRRVRDETGFASRVRELVDAANAREPIPLGDRECAGIARSISRWTWNVYGRGAAAAQAHRSEAGQTREEYLRAQALARREARRLRADGFGATAIAKQLGRSRSWVYVALGEADAKTVQTPALSGFARVPPVPSALESSSVEEPKPSNPVTSLIGFLARRSPAAAEAFVASRTRARLSRDARGAARGP